MTKDEIYKQLTPLINESLKQAIYGYKLAMKGDLYNCQIGSLILSLANDNLSTCRMILSQVPK